MQHKVVSLLVSNYDAIQCADGYGWIITAQDLHCKLIEENTGMSWVLPDVTAECRNMIDQTCSNLSINLR